jgi:pimeloyl-ACP methyl ester carboxylesterase
VAELSFTQLAGSGDGEYLVVVGPSLGTGVAELWQRCADLLPATWQVVGWDLPGHGAGAPSLTPLTVDDLADAVRVRACDLAAGRSVAYAGVSLGGAVGFVLAATDATPFRAVVTLASTRRFATPELWLDRARLVRSAGTAALVVGSAQRWFAPGFLDREPAAGSALLLALQHVDDESYALACEALATYDVRSRPARVPLLVAGGRHDVVVPAAEVDIVLEKAAHLPPIEDSAATAALITDFLDEKLS